MEDANHAVAQGIDARIRQHRMGTVRLRVETAEGRPLANGPVAVRQTRHRFLFGCNLFKLGAIADAGLQREHDQRFADLLNYATLPFYWSSYEAQEGETKAQRLREMGQWCIAHGIKAKGHTLCYHMTTPAWAQERAFREMAERQFSRITREVAEFAGLVDIWDVVNEMVWTPRHEAGKHPLAKLSRRMGRVGMVKQAFELARQANPAAQLILNDCDPVPDYAKLVRESLAAGAAIDVVGIQSHMHKGYWAPEKTWRVCEEYAAFGKPLHFSELTILSGIIQPNHSWKDRRDDWFSTPEGEALQAEQVRELYRLLFSHPAVHAITWWDFSDHGAWLGAPAGLVRKDMSPKPAYDALMELIKGQWWSGERTLRTDEQGQVEFDGFLGDYTVTATGGTATMSLDKPAMSSAAVKLEHKESAA